MNKDEYLNKLLEEIKIKEIKGEKGVFKINEKIPDNIAKYIELYLKTNTKHIVKFERCTSCKKTWDIIILFTKR